MLHTFAHTPRLFLNRRFLERTPVRVVSRSHEYPIRTATGDEVYENSKIRISEFYSDSFEVLLKSDPNGISGLTWPQVRIEDGVVIGDVTRSGLTADTVAGFTEFSFKMICDDMLHP
jgi:hypothetical protein